MDFVVSVPCQNFRWIEALKIFDLRCSVSLFRGTNLVAYWLICRDFYFVNAWRVHVEEISMGWWNTIRDPGGCVRINVDASLSLSTFWQISNTSVTSSWLTPHTPAVNLRLAWVSIRPVSPSMIYTYYIRSRRNRRYSRPSCRSGGAAEDNTFCSICIGGMTAVPVRSPAVLQQKKKWGDLAGHIGFDVWAGHWQAGNNRRGNNWYKLNQYLVDFQCLRFSVWQD